MGYTLRDAAGNKYPIGVMLRIGSDPGNQVVLPGSKISQLHCSLSDQNGSLVLRDEGSTNGTFVNQTRIQGMAQIFPGDALSIGDVVFIVEQIPDQVPAPVLPLPSAQPVQFMPPPAANPPAMKQGGISPVFPLIFIILISLLCFGSAFGGLYYYKASQPEKDKILTFFGKGPATIQMENMSDYPVYVFATSNVERTVGDDSSPVFEWEIIAYDINEITDQAAGVYRLDFGSQPGEMDLGT